MPQVEMLTIFLASPGDVQAERELLVRCVNDLNLGIAKDRGYLLEVVRWETHSRPGLGRAQALINDQTGPMGNHAMFIGIMWSRFGSPTGIAESGTEEEFRAAKDSFEKTGQPQVMFYFSQQSVAPGDVRSAEQLLKVAQFREELYSQGLVGHYKDPADFQEQVRRHLTSWLLTLSQTTPTASTSESIATPASQTVSQISESTIPSPSHEDIAEDSGMWLILGQSFLKSIELVQQGENTIEVMLPADSSVDDSAVRNVANLKGPLPFAHANDAAIVEVMDSRRIADAKGTRWSLKLRIRDSLRGDSSIDVSTNGYSADAIAEKRVRRALLNEKPVKAANNTFASMDFSEAFLMSMISGMNSPLKVERGAIPDLAEKIGSNSPEFLKLARLYSVLLVRGSLAVGTVEHLILQRMGEDKVSVDFKGQRPKIYSNVEPISIHVTGTCSVKD